jgi:hydroxyacyl-ACP dehydratase HTD2-like protein with hotdog domain
MIPLQFLPRTISRALHPSQTRSSSASPAEIAERFLYKFKDGPATVRKQLLDANQLQLFSLTLNRPRLYPNSDQALPSLESSPPKSGTPLPPGYHLAYFTVPILEQSLGLDGSDRSYNPDQPFTRRMWAGGSSQWPSTSSDTLLRVGDTATETTRVVSCEPKAMQKTGHAMLVVGVEKQFHNSKGALAVIDRRNWVFQEALDLSNPPVPVERKPALPPAELPDGDNVRRFNQSVVTLFRFSALTFNGHRIHYDKPWCQNVEGHRNCVVHGPMNLINMLEFWRDLEAEKSGRLDIEAQFPKEIKYRSTSPLYAGEPYSVIIDKDNGRGGMTDVKVMSDDGTICMKGSIEAN